MNIFVVEDSPSIRRLLVRRLDTMSGARVIGEANGEAEATALVEWLQPDTVLMDLSLADGGSGLKVLAQLRKSGFTGRVFVLTSQSMDAYRDACLKAGADGFYDKASGLETLFDDLSDLIEQEPRKEEPGRSALLLRDGLTGLFGQEALLERLDQAVKIAGRDGNELAVYVMTMDGLNTLAQDHGDAEVNAVISDISTRLLELCEPSDVVARHAADQFSLVLTRVESPKAAAEFAEGLSGLLAEAFAQITQPRGLRTHVGMALFPGDAFAPRALLTLAEAHAYGTLHPQRPSVFTH